MENKYDVIIIGGGPAGLTAAIYTSRAFLSTLVIAGNPPGGQLMNTTEVENYPGFIDGIMGPELVSVFREQAKRFNSSFVDENVLEVSGTFETGFTVKTVDNEYFAKALIVATGASAKWLGLDNEQRLMGKGVSACATCDGFFFKNKVIAVVGAGDSAMEEATFLTRFASKVYILVRKSKEEMRASKFMISRAEENPKIEFIFNTSVVDVLGAEKVSGITVKNIATGELSDMKEVEGLFLAIGHTPSTKFLAGFLDLDENGYIKVVDNTKTSVEGVFAGGDVSDFRYRQAITASGLGCMAALDLEKFLSEHGVNVSPSTTW